MSAQSKFDEVMSRGVLSGNVQIDAQMYQTDSLIGAEKVDEKFRSNSYAYLQYTNGKFTLGARFEGYFKPMLGYDARYEGAGVPYYFARFSGDIVDVTLGNFYEQFGSGMLLRSYQDWNLGLDNSIFGARAIVTPIDGIVIKGVVGSYRHFWEKQGLIRGIDADFSLNDFIKPMRDWETRIRLGGSFVSKYQAAQTWTITETEGDTTYAYDLATPQNVGSAGVRFALESHGFSFNGEYDWKGNDPTVENGQIYKPGQALLLNMGYSRRGFGVLLSAKSVDNMGFRADRSETGNYGMINYLPALSRQHTYSIASFYPYACQPNGEVGFQADIFYKIKKGTVLGGKYGTDIKLNASVATALNEKQINPETPIRKAGTYGYRANIFAVSDSIYFVDANIELSHKFSKHFKGTLMYMYEQYNQEVVEGHGEFIKAHIVVGDFTYMFLKKHALRLELQYMHTKQAERDWLMATLEYTLAPKWFLSVSDMWNFGNEIKEQRLHYYYVSAAYVHDAMRVSLSYGRIRKGIMCAGGVCRELPASNGLMLSLTSSF